jgi:hypothetical protein
MPGMDALDASICENLYAEPNAVAPPYFAYSHTSAVVPGEQCSRNSSAITGLAFYEQGGYPSRYQGALFFADVYRSCIWVMLPGSDGLPSPANIEPFMTGAVTPVDLRIGPGGDLYYTSVATGTLHRIHYDPSNQPPSASITTDGAAGDAPLTVAFDGSSSIDTDPGDTLTYAWDLDDDGAFDDATTPQASFTFEDRGTHRVRLRVTDAAGATDVATTLVTVGSTPAPVIDTPTVDTNWSVGGTVSFAGHATDPLDGDLPPSSLSWSLVLLHCYATGDCHQHAVRDFTATDTGSFVAPDHPWPARLQLQLTATNSYGVEATTSVTIDPRTVRLHFDSEPEGLQIAAGGDVGTTPFTSTVIAGSRLTVTAVSPQVSGGATYDFSSWDDGASAQRDLTASLSGSYTATFHRKDAPPVANAGPDLTVGSKKSFVLDGSQSTDPDGDPLTYAWTQVGGTPVVMHNEHTASLSVDGVKGPATLTFQLTVTDTSGQVHTDTVVVTVRSK